jgi:hypothetical protein
MAEEQAAQAPGKPDVKAEIRRLPLVEKVLAAIAVLVIIGWIMTWASQDLFLSSFFRRWSTPLSFFGALAIATLVILKVFGVRPLPPAVESKVIPIASLVPVLGFLIDKIIPFHDFLTFGGSIALAYISATTYWRRHIPTFATRPLGEAPADAPATAGMPPPPV